MANFDYKQIYNQHKLRSHPDFEKITRIDIFDYHYNLIGQYNLSDEV